jgi:hypothetical protein
MKHIELGEYLSNEICNKEITFDVKKREGKVQKSFSHTLDIVYINSDISDSDMKGFPIYIFNVGFKDEEDMEEITFETIDRGYLKFSEQEEKEKLVDIALGNLRNYIREKCETLDVKIREMKEK